MKTILIFFVLMSTASARVQLAADWVTPEKSVHLNEASKDLSEILTAEAEALDSFSVPNLVSPGLPGGFEMKEMVTDIGVSKKGLLGLSSVKANTGVEIKWKKKAVNAFIGAEESDADVVIEDITEAELPVLAESLAQIVEKSGKIRKTRNLRGNILSALEKVHNQLRHIQLTEGQKLKLSGLRLDLNFGASGRVWFVAKAGAALRLRMEWKIKKKPLNEGLVMTRQTQMIAKMLSDLDAAVEKVSFSDFQLKKVSVGVGLSQKKKLFGLWKYKAGFMGFLIFVPSSGPKLSAPATVSPEFMPSNFSSGIEKSLHTASFFMEHAREAKSTFWYVAEVKAVFGISHSGFFGLSDVTSKGLIEIDFKRNI